MAKTEIFRLSYYDNDIKKRYRSLINKYLPIRIKFSALNRFLENRPLEILRPSEKKGEEDIYFYRFDIKLNGKKHTVLIKYRITGHEIKMLDIVKIP